MAYNDNNFGSDGGNRNVWSSGSRGGSRGGYSRTNDDNDDDGQRGGGSYRGSFGNNNSREAVVAAAVVVADMDFDDQMIMGMFKFSPMQYSFKIYRKILHVKKLSKLFQLSDKLKWMIDQVVPKFGFIKIVILVREMVELQ